MHDIMKFFNFGYTTANLVFKQYVFQYNFAFVIDDIFSNVIIKDDVPDEGFFSTFKYTFTYLNNNNRLIIFRSKSFELFMLQSRKYNIVMNRSGEILCVKCEPCYYCNSALQPFLNLPALELQDFCINLRKKASHNLRIHEFN